MEEIEVPLESVQEDLHHRAAHSTDRWIMAVAMTSALLAVLAAITSLLAGYNVNEAMLHQMKSTDQWSYYQAKSIKASQLSSKMDILQALGKETPEADTEKLKKYREEQAEIQKNAEELEMSSRSFMHSHEEFARSVTMFQVAIGVAALSVLMRRRIFWYGSLAFGATGMFFFVSSLLTMSHH